jgi:NAD(P)-dependent dehydrogenase (short-subunit alcohol dehydrogenase family)
MSSIAGGLAPASSFEGRVALVTGGASGIGRAITEKLVASGARVAVWDVREDRLAELAERHGERVLTQVVDVSDKRQVDDAADLVQSQWGGIAHLVNNAGIIGKRMTLADLDAEELDRVLSVNLKSVFYVTAAFAARAGSFADRSMVSMASIAARTGGMVGNMAYAATKGAIVTLTHAFSKELAPHVRVNALAPGIIDTEIQLDSLGDPAAVAALADIIPLRRLGAPAEVAEAAVWLLSPASSYISASVLDVAGGR